MGLLLGRRTPKNHKIKRRTGSMPVRVLVVEGKFYFLAISSNSTSKISVELEESPEYSGHRRPDLVGKRVWPCRQP